MTTSDVSDWSGARRNGLSFSWIQQSLHIHGSKASACFKCKSAWYELSNIFGICLFLTLIWDAMTKHPKRLLAMLRIIYNVFLTIVCSRFVDQAASYCHHCFI
jgi:Na+/phosphate symporter